MPTQPEWILRAAWCDCGRRVVWRGNQYRMGLPELEGARQCWALNEYDRALLQRQMASNAVPRAMKALCKALIAYVRKAEQVGRR